MKAYPDGTSKRIKQLSDTVTAGANNEMRLQKAEGCGSLPTAFQSLVEAKKIFLYTGANSGDGVPQIDGPLGAAILAHTLYQANKVAIIVADRTNIHVVRRILHQVNPELAEHIRYVEVNAVNGILVNQMDALIAKHKRRKSSSGRSGATSTRFPSTALRSCCAARTSRP